MNKLNFLDTITNSETEGPVVVRRTWQNERKEDQVTVQFAQRIKVPGTPTSNVLVALAQGITGAGTNVATALMSFNKETFIKLFGEEITQDFTGGDAPLASDIFGQEVNIEVTDSCFPNEYSSNHNPRINPRTKEPIMVNDKEVYRHTEVVTGTAEHSFDASNGRSYPRSYTPKVAAENVSVHREAPVATTA